MLFHTLTELKIPEEGGGVVSSYLLEVKTRFCHLLECLASKCPTAGAYHLQPATTPYSCHEIFTDRSIFYFLLSRIQIPTGTSVTNCNHKHGLLLTCRHDVDMYRRGRIVLSLPKHAHVNWNWPISQEKYLK